MRQVRSFFVILLFAMMLPVFAQPVEQRVVHFDSLHKSKILTKPSPYYSNGSSLVFTDDGLLCGKGYAAPMLRIPADLWDWSEGAVAYTLTPIDFDSTSMEKEFVLLYTYFQNHNKPELGFKPGDTCMLLRMKRPDLKQPESIILQGQDGKQETQRAYIAIASNRTGFFPEHKPSRIAVIWRNGGEASVYLNGVKISSGKIFHFPGPDKLRHVNLLSGNSKEGWGVLDGTAYMTDLLLVKGRTSIEELRLLENSMPAIKEETAAPAPAEKVQTNTLPAVPFPPLKAAPQLDGIFSEYGFVTSGMIDESSGLLVDFPCHFYTAADADNLYLGMMCDWSKKTPYDPVSSASVNDDTALISSGDIAPFFFRGAIAPEEKSYSGTYLTIAPNNCVYDALEEIDWNRNRCMRNEKFDSGVKTYSSCKDGIWRLELVLPRKQNGLMSEEFQFSAGVRLQNRSLHLKNHTLWFDNVDAFLTGKRISSPLSCAIEKQKTGWQITTDGNADYQVSLDHVRKVTSIKEVVVDQVIGASSSYQPMENLQQISGKNLLQAIPQPPLGLYAISYRATAADGSILLARQLPFLQRKDVELILLNNPIAKQLNVKAEFPGITVRKGDAFTLVLQTEAGTRIFSKSITVSQEAPSELNFDLETGNLEQGNYLVKISRGTQELAEAGYVVKPLPEWLTNPLAMKALEADYAPAPWKDGVVVSSTRVSVWGRVFLFGKNGLEQITSQGKIVLSAPLVLQYLKDGKQRQIILGLKELRPLGKGRVLAVTEGQDKDFRCTIRHTIEFDGLDILELEALPLTQDCAVEEMELVLPVSEAQHFQSLYDYCSQEFGYTVSRTFNRLTALWLGNDDCGINTFFENHKGLFIDSRKPRIRLEAGKSAGEFLYRLALVNVPVKVARPITWRMGLHPTPVKPLYPNWENERVFMMEYFMPPFNFICLHTHGHAANSTDFRARNQKLGRDWGEMGRIHNQKIYPYTIATFISKENMIKGDAPHLRYRLPDDYFYAPDERPQSQDWAEFGADWSFQPISTYPGDGSRHNEMIACSPASSWSDYAVWMMKTYLEDGGFAGFYFDLTTTRENCDESRGYRYDTLDGKSEGTRELFATRNLFKRLYCAFASLKGEGIPTIFGHGYPILSGSSSFWGVCVHGEEFKPKRLLGLSDMLLVDKQSGNPVMNVPPPDAKRDYSGVLWRIAFSPYRWGIPLVHLSQYAFIPEFSRNPKSGREMLALCFVNNTLFDPSYAHWPTGEEFHLRVTMPFQMGGTSFHGYWKNGIQSKPDCVKVSYWKKENARDWLVAVANWSEKDVSAEIVLPPELLNAAYVYNMETPNRVPRWEIVTIPWSVHIPAMDLRVFRFTGAK